MTTATTTTSTATTRLHITPFNPDILPSVLPPSVQPTATEVSFHTLPTFPENNYGYVTLPTMEAEKIKKKLHGSILKGRKFKVETARPQKEKELEPNESDSGAERSSKKKSSKKRKAGEDVLDGHELSSGRKVKRGWTESTDSKADRRKDEKKKKKEKKAKAQAKSKYTEKEECLFRMQLPPNKASALEEKQDKKSKKKKKSPSESVVHEFANTITHPSFIRSGAENATTTATYEEGKGWVDDSGNVKEPVNEKIQDSRHRPGKVPGAKEKPKSKSKRSTKKAKPAPKEESEESEDWTSSSGSLSEDSDSESESESADTSETSDESSNKETKEGKKQSNTSATTKPATPSDEDQSSDANEQPNSKEVHPLEALYKRSAPASSEAKPAEETNGFSFFGDDDDMESEEEPPEPVAPQTPFAKEELRARGLRSAAPTPDTGLVSRTIKWDEYDDEMNVDDESSIDTPVVKKGGAGESDFAKWFWENRGDNNRAWKKRRREAAKEERQRENRRKGLKGKS
ncbi:uncharacterized protein ACHE_60702S [Aspergillus chevalieri]|uniref:Suppressor protein SRP40 n=1 Tax=Aspergillus chevalieri TaxID=182096 RepID=A0A7R7ZRJ7_ASPCH|nr:uncharacterized protein ACHE_60702S [Aspergillus chevalieri]BCR90816.1 hypothetical protein ACHE_60702S [Aspergillus chevalieri]